jgi:putative transposase
VVAVQQISEAQESGCRIDPACKIVGIDKRTFERWRKDPCGDKRCGPLTAPANKLTDQERKEIVSVANSAKYRDKSPSQIVPALADDGLYIGSESSFYRVLKSEKLNAHRGRSKPATRKKPEELVATEPNQIYSWDITYLKSTITGLFFYLYFVLDIYSRKIVGFTAHDVQSSELASVLINNICEAEGIQPNQLTLHSDNGGPMKGSTMLATLQRLGVMPSFSRPSVSDDNPYSESLFRTAKYCPLFQTKPFESPAAVSDWAAKFVAWYNEEHFHSGIGFVTPGSRHRRDDIEILEKRHAVYERAKAKNPNRWSGKTRNWTQISEVFLNCLKGKSISDNTLAA